ncbi:hypothetical protein ID866_10577 [Astraeus odoratus]|nr:hypothetical protein ID866_10577 [Astraeus odoratus]
MRDDKITILVLQETHLTQDHTTILNGIFSDSLLITSSLDQNHPHSKEVAIVFNKRLLGSKNEKINILGVYPPNDPTENKHFWETIHDSIINLLQPDVILGDFNFVEDPLDGLPAHFDSPNTTEAWCSLKFHLHLTNGWRK